MTTNLKLAPIIFFLLYLKELCGLSASSYPGSSLFKPIREKFFDNFSNGPKNNKKPKTESEKLIEYVDYKPWRGPKPVRLAVHYKPWSESWQERFVQDNESTIYLYSIPGDRRGWDLTRPDDVWEWPWLWTKNKAERLTWIHKCFMNDLSSVTVQEHMEMDAFFSEFDMPVRWGFLRLQELDSLNAFGMTLAFFTDFNGIQPTDLGLLPDGTLRTCPVQFHNCISSSQNPNDIEHYAPQLRWSRSKSPEQAFDEVKNMFYSYPKRGLSWTHGWIDRGGWKPQEFSGSYFYAQANSLFYGFTDDIEILLNNENREVSLRMSSRLGQSDFGVQKLRYNQFVRMLQKKGGWEVRELPKDNFELSTPYRWTEILIDKSARAIERLADEIIADISSVREGGTNADSIISSGATRRLLDDLLSFVDPLVEDVRELYQRNVDSNEEVQKLKSTIENTVNSIVSAEKKIEENIDSVFGGRDEPISSDASSQRVEQDAESTNNDENKPTFEIPDVQSYRINVMNAIDSLGRFGKESIDKVYSPDTGSGDKSSPAQQQQQQTVRELSKEEFLQLMKRQKVSTRGPLEASTDALIEATVENKSPSVGDTLLTAAESYKNRLSNRGRVSVNW